MQGLEANATYPPSTTNNSCKFNQSLVVAPINGYSMLPSGYEFLLQSAVWLNGSIAVTIEFPKELENYT